VDHFHLHSSTPVPPAWGPLPKRNLTSGLQGRIALRRQWGSSRLLGSNSQPGSPAPWSADLFADDPCSIPDQPAHRFHSGRVGPKAGVELAMTGAQRINLPGAPTSYRRHADPTSRNLRKTSHTPEQAGHGP